VVWEGLDAAERAAAHIVELSEPRFWRPQVSSTFHGRDILAPVAAHLAGGTVLKKAGRPREGLFLLPDTQPTIQGDGSIQGKIVHIDHFGNCGTNIPAAQAAALGAIVVEVGGRVLHGLARTYADGRPGTPIALIGSDGRLEIAVREDSAATLLGLAIGAPVQMRKE
jgi:S-adenosylmethionine hydrolase